MTKATDTQVGGNHYQDMAIQPIDYIVQNELGYLEGNVIKYVSRHKAKAGRQDIEKAIHYCQMILEMEYGDAGSCEEVPTKAHRDDSDLLACITTHKTTPDEPYLCVRCGETGNRDKRWARVDGVNMCESCHEKYKANQAQCRECKRRLGKSTARYADWLFASDGTWICHPCQVLLSAGGTS